MRIIAGEYRGRPLASLGKGDAAAHLRPTSDRVRESLFSALTHLDVVQSARVLDLFAGTGALGLEALSRGAAHVTFVENGRKAQKLIAQNISTLDVGGRAQLLRLDAMALSQNQDKAYDLIFLDPPYGKDMGQKALDAARLQNWIAPQAQIIWEERQPMQPPLGFELVARRKYGDTHVTQLCFVAA